MAVLAAAEPELFRWEEQRLACRPDGSLVPLPGVCSQAHQSLFQLPPSIWWAAVAVPHTNPSGKRSVTGLVPSSVVTGRDPTGRPGRSY